MIGDGRHKLATAEEAALHAEVCGLVRATCAAYVARRAAEEEADRGHPVSTGWLKRELADVLGLSERQLNALGHDTPITLARAIRLAEVTGDDRLLQHFAARLGQVSVAVADLPRVAGDPDAHALLTEQMRETAEAQSAALPLLQQGRLDAQAFATLVREGTEAVQALLRTLLCGDLRANGRLTLPFVRRAAGHHAPHEDRP